MPYGKGKGGHKGKTRKFTNIEELKSQQKEEQWRERKRNDDTSSEEESSSEEEDNKSEPVIQVSNPNRVVNKAQKLSQLGDMSQKPELSRREREEINKQEAKRRYEQLHAAGKTDEARADLARLALVRKQREEAKAARLLEKQEAEERQRAAKEASLNAIKSTSSRSARNRRKK